jgi:hypothetical protein
MSKNTYFRVSNDSPQSERRNVIKNDQRVREGGTYHQITAAEAGMVGGRFAVEAKQRVTGPTPVRYPTLPPSSPWASDPVPREPSLGFSVDALEPLGTAAEIEQSLQDLAGSQGGDRGIDRSTLLSPNDPPSGDGCSTAGLRRSAVSPAPSPHSSLRTKRAGNAHNVRTGSKRGRKP